MNFFQLYLNNIVSELFLTKFYHINRLTNMPKLDKLVLSFKYKNPAEKLIIKSLLALEVMSGCRAKIIVRKKSNLNLKLGQPVGCKIVLRNSNMFNFLSNILFAVNSIKTQNKSGIKKKIVSNGKIINSINLNIESLHIMPEFENQYNLLNNLSSLNITLVIKNNGCSEFLFLNNLLKIG